MTGLHDLVHRYPTIKGLRGREGPNVMCFHLDPSPELGGLPVYFKVEWFISNKKRA